MDPVLAAFILCLAILGLFLTLVLLGTTAAVIGAVGIGLGVLATIVRAFIGKR